MNDRVRFRMLVLATACTSVTCGCIDAVTEGVTSGINEVVSNVVIEIGSTIFDQLLGG